MRASTASRCSPSPTSKPVRHFLHAAVPDRRRMRQYGCEQEGTKASSRRDADAARDARGRCAPRRPRPRARNVRGGRATRTHVSRSSRGNRSDVPRSHVTPARMPSCARCRSRTARVSRSIVSSSPCAWDGGRWRGGRAAQFKSSDPAQTGNEYTASSVSSRRDVANSDHKLLHDRLHRILRRCRSALCGRRRF